MFLLPRMQVDGPVGYTLRLITILLNGQTGCGRRTLPGCEKVTFHLSE